MFLWSVFFLVVGFVCGSQYGYYGRRKKFFLEAGKCVCGHLNIIHYKGGSGSCGWKNSNMKCMCMRFTVDGRKELV